MSFSGNNQMHTMSDFELLPSSGFNQQLMLGLTVDSGHQTHPGRIPLGALEVSATENVGYGFTRNTLLGMPQSSDASMLLNPGWPSVGMQGAWLAPHKENLALDNGRPDFESSLMDCDMIAPFDATVQGSAGMEAPPSGPILTPTSSLSRLSRPKMQNNSANRRVISRKSSVMPSRDLKLQYIPPIRLIEHLENEFRSNRNISDNCRRRAEVHLDKLINVVHRESKHGSPAARTFLSGEEDGRTDTPSLSVAPENFPPFPSQSMNAPISKTFPIYSDNFNDNSALMPAADELSTQCSTNKTIYYCTYRGCSQLCNSRADWMRHEKIKTHWMQNQYMCPCCVITQTTLQHISCTFCLQHLPSMADAKGHCLECPSARTSGKTFPRKDKFGHHLRSKHGIFKMSKEMESWTFSVDGNWPRQCGWCDKQFQDFEERADHLEGHFREGKTMADYKHPISLSADSAGQLYHGGENDAEIHGAGSSGWDQTQGGMASPQGYNPGWLENRSAFAGDVQSQIG